QQRVGGVLVHRVRTEDEIDAPRRLEGAHVQVAPQRPDVIDPDLVAERLQHIQVWMRPALDACAVAEQRGGEEKRCPLLADAGRAVQEVRVRGAFAERGFEQTLGVELLGNRLERHRSSGSTALHTSSAISSTPRGVPSASAVGTMRQSWRPASSRYTSRVARLCPASASWMSASSVV